jgi:alkanesulfonate monooxygenase SsuD/methylene tetrahydromethanopterin reductase-like flavin-dependent oxidoreductase (luciferase family)
MAKMEFASFDEANYNWFDSVPQAADALERSIREAQQEEKVGFKYHFIIEHQGHVVGQIQSPAPYLAALAQHTTTLRIGAMVFLLPFYNPLRLAMDTALVDQLSRGRLEFGCGVAGNPDSFKAWNVHFPVSERRQAGAEALEVIQKAWTADRFTHHGKYYRYEDAISMPRPYQKPHPPIWFAGLTKTSLELCVSRGYGVGVGVRNDEECAAALNQWRQMWKDSGQKGPRPHSFLARSVYVAETDEQAYEEAALYLPQSYTWGDQKFSNTVIGEEKNLEATSATQRRNEIRAGQRSGVDYWIENELAYVGSPESVIRSLEKSQKLVGYDLFGGTFRHGPMPEDLVMKNLKLFGEKVMPAFTDAPAPVLTATGD